MLHLDIAVEEMRETTASRGFPIQGPSEPAPAKGAGWDGSNCKGYLDLQLDW